MPSESHLSQAVGRDKHRMRQSRLVAIGLLLVAGCSRCDEQQPSAPNAATETNPTETSSEDEPTPDPERAPRLHGLGNYTYRVSTEHAEAQRFFDQGLILAWGFDHKEAERSFRHAARLDPKCAMCFWGAALVAGPNINAPMDAASVPDAVEAIERADELKEETEPHEQALIDALRTRYTNEPPEDRSELDRAYAQAMHRVVERFPDDLVIAQLYAESLMDLHPWDYWQSDGEPQPWTPEILEVLEGVLRRDERAIGANHLYIHAVEASRTPERATQAADTLANLIPGASHLVHMPSHIYIRTGRYREASDANRRAIEADRGYITQCRAQEVFPLMYHPHNWHFLWVTSALEGKREAALEAAREVQSKTKPDLMANPEFVTMQHYYVTPYYAYVRFGMWDEALAAPAPAEELLYPRAMRHFMRGMAHAAKGRGEQAREELALLEPLATNEALKNVTVWGINSAFSLVGIATELLRGEIDVRENNYDTGIPHLQRAVELQKGLNYDEPPDWPFPLRHYLGAALLEAGKPREAETVYREDLDEYAENGWSLFGFGADLRSARENPGGSGCTSALSARLGERRCFTSDVSRRHPARGRDDNDQYALARSAKAPHPSRQGSGLEHAGTLRRESLEPLGQHRNPESGSVERFRPGIRTISQVLTAQELFGFILQPLIRSFHVPNRAGRVREAPAGRRQNRGLCHLATDLNPDRLPLR